MDASEVFDVKQEDDVLVVAPLRNISSLAEDEVQNQWDQIVGQIDQPAVNHVVFDMEKVDYFGSSMLEAMLYLWKKVDSESGKMAVCNVSSTAHEILSISRFDTIWPICASLDEALSAVHAQSSD